MTAACAHMPGTQADLLFRFNDGKEGDPDRDDHSAVEKGNRGGAENLL